MKKCTKCKVNDRLSNKHYHCKECRNAYGRKNYQENKERYFAQAKARDIQIDQLINSYKDKPCSDCGIKYEPFVMDFDHMPGQEKLYGISEMRKRRMAFSKIVDEIAKCEVVCANCHRMRTNKRNPTRYTMSEGDF